MALAFSEETASIHDGGLRGEMFIGDELHKYWEASLCGECGIGLGDDSPEGTGARTPSPFLSQDAFEKGGQYSVASSLGMPSFSGFDGMPNGSEISSGARTPPQLEMLQHLLQMHLKLGNDLQSLPSDRSQTSSTKLGFNPWGSTPVPGRSSENSCWLSSVVPPPGLAPSAATDATPLPSAGATVAANTLATNSVVAGATMLPSVGSKGHPHNCAGACKYVKRKGGCRLGADCDLCHLCFWQRQPAKLPAQTQDGKDRETQQDLHEEPSDSTLAPQSIGKVEENSSTSEAKLSSLGSRNHPFGCGAACKYVRRKGGCREGANCPNCHECRWRRGQDAGQTVAGLGAKTSTGYSSEAVDVLEKLISMQIETVVQAPEVDIQQEPVKVSLADVMSFPSTDAPLNGSEMAQLNPEQALEPCVTQEVTSIGSVGHPFSCALACKYNGKRAGCKDGASCTRCHLCHWSRMAVRSVGDIASV